MFRAHGMLEVLGLTSVIQVVGLIDGDSTLVVMWAEVPKFLTLTVAMTILDGHHAASPARGGTQGPREGAAAQQCCEGDCHSRSDVPNTFGACFYMEPYGGRPTARVPNVLFSSVKMKAGCSGH